ncbi:MAG TPA: NADH-quinone oxidoreductase subunit NuoE [Candidatus Latescibacteria bacterium]|nr:NADH-quinone oxidoreductase subunit NuoE [Candidatus Latescibacterota bacterium]HOF61351.1 NADH-quinone oxidoreductase subunit NuoE [Candidatus Latescibacterota bacterium]HOS64066.1 NADH-quinone oxidoreductase subunit NuoE [Candidatus Latescibacterota bacterium]HPC44035.1 NADH-quinone oxidoreductase subunit NuoE [Candidatus Latescibacterota bacterium]HPK74921.1 NADH-quinone oxidoreductase subunit NuoE [Candidatus Latescibacterota bacterium]
MPVQISQTTQEKIAELLTRYPVKQGALLPILHLVQDELGALSLEALDWVARQIEVSPATVYGVATFYPMFRMEPVGQHHIKVCASLPCALAGCRELIAALKEKLGIEVGQTTPDGKYTLSKTECLAACTEAPAVLVNKKLHRKVTAENASEFLAGFNER